MPRCGLYGNLVPGGGGGEEPVSPEQIEAAVNKYLTENPVQAGATAEQAAQIEQNKNDISLNSDNIDYLKSECGSKGNALTDVYDDVSIFAENTINGIIKNVTVFGTSEGAGVLNESTGKYEIILETKNRNHFEPDSLTLDNGEAPGYGYTTFNGKKCFKFSDGGGYTFRYNGRFEPNTKYSIGFLIYREEGVDKRVGFTVYFSDGTVKTITGAPGTRRWITVDSSKTIDYVSNAFSYNIAAYLSIDDCIILKDELVSYGSEYENDEIPYSAPEKSSFTVELQEKLYDGSHIEIKNQLKSFDGETYIMSYQKTRITAIINMDTHYKITEIINNSGFNHYHAIGDSITRGEFGDAVGKQYWTYMRELCGIKEITSDGVNSTCLSTGDGSPEIEAGSVINRLKNIPLTADIISIFIGTNDFGRGHELGTIEDDSTDTFYGALKYTCDYLHTNHSNACCFFMTPIQRVDLDAEGRKLSDYVDAMIEVCNKYSIPVFDTFSLFYPKNEKNKEKYFSSDGLHINPEGHKKLGKAEAKYIMSELVL